MFFYPQKCLKTFLYQWTIFYIWRVARNFSWGLHGWKILIDPAKRSTEINYKQLKITEKTRFYMKNVFTKPNGGFNPLPPPNATVSVDVDVLNTVWCAQCNYTRDTDYYQIKSNIRLLLELIIDVTAASMI